MNSKTPSQLYSVDDRIQVWDDGGRSVITATKNYRDQAQKPDAGRTDHVLAQSRGGSDELNNLVVCCKHCNTEKGNADYITFLQNRVAQAEKQVRRLNQLIVAYYSKQP